MRLTLLAALGLISMPVLAQDPIPPLNEQSLLTELVTKGAVKVTNQDNGMIRETANLRVRFSSELSDGIKPMSDGITLDNNAIPPSPCIMVFIPPGALVPASNGFRLISTDPKLSGVQFYQTDANGNVIADLTQNLRSFDARLRTVSDMDDTWRLVIEARSEAQSPQWLPLGSSTSTIVTFGNDAGATVLSGMEWVQKWEPPGG